MIDSSEDHRPLTSEETLKGFPSGTTVLTTTQTDMKGDMPIRLWNHTLETEDHVIEMSLCHQSEVHLISLSEKRAPTACHVLLLPLLDVMENTENLLGLLTVLDPLKDRKSNSKLLSCSDCIVVLYCIVLYCIVLYCNV